MIAETDYLEIYLNIFKQAYSNKAAIILDMNNQEVYSTESFNNLLLSSSNTNTAGQKPTLEWQENEILNLFGQSIGTLIRFNPINQSIKNFKGGIWNLNRQLPCSAN